MPKASERLIEGLASNLLGRCSEVTIDYTVRLPKVTLDLTGQKGYAPGPKVQERIVDWDRSGQIWKHIYHDPAGNSAVIRIKGERR